MNASKELMQSLVNPNIESKKVMDLSNKEERLDYLICEAHEICDFLEEGGPSERELGAKLSEELAPLDSEYTDDADRPGYLKAISDVLLQVSELDVPYYFEAGHVGWALREHAEEDGPPLNTRCIFLA